MNLLNKPRGALRDALQSLKQSLRTANRHRLHRRRMKKGADYASWIASKDTPTEQDRAEWRRWMAAHPGAPKVSLLLLLEADTRADLLQHSIDSVLAQVYPNWELTPIPAAGLSGECRRILAQAATTDARIRAIGSTQATEDPRDPLRQSTGSWSGMLRPGDQLREQCMLLMLQATQAQPQARLIYADEDQITANGQRTAHHFKPDWNHDFLLSANYIGRAAFIARDHLLSKWEAGLTAQADPAMDAILRSVEDLPPEHIVHVPHVLWHFAASTHHATDDAVKAAVQSHLDRTSPGAKASTSRPGLLQVRYPLPEPPPLVSIVICTRNQYKLLSTCIQSITGKTNYPRYEIIIVDNGSDEDRTLGYLEELPRQDARIKVIRDDSPFNYAALNNMAVGHAQGDMVALLNNDIEVIDGDWLAEMVGHALRPGIGCVGAKLLYPDDTVQHAGVLVGAGSDAPGSIAAHYLRGIPREAPGYANRAIATLQLTAVTAACLVIRKDTFLKLKGLDSEHLAVTYNDVDFCLRVGELGLRNVLTPHALLYHHESVSRGRDASAKNIARFLPEMAYMQKRWATQLKHDPCYNPNLSYIKPDFLLPQQSETP